MTRRTYRIGTAAGAPLAAGLLLIALAAGVRELLATRTLSEAGLRLPFVAIPALLVGVLAFQLARSRWLERVEGGSLVLSAWHGRATEAVPLDRVRSCLGPMGSLPLLPRSLRGYWFWLRVDPRSGRRRSYVVVAGTEATADSLASAAAEAASRRRGEGPEAPGRTA